MTTRRSLRSRFLALSETVFDERLLSHIYTQIQYAVVVRAPQQTICPASQLEDVQRALASYFARPRIGGGTECTCG
jgi:hypothetical protein